MAQSDSTGNTTAVGTYCWRAEYSGDAFYNPSSHTNKVSECFTTQPQAPVIETNSAPQGASIVPGTTASDQVTVNGQFGAGTGTVTFFLCGPGLANAATGAGCPTGGTQIGGSVALVERIRGLGVDVECADARYRRLLLAVRVHAGSGKPVHGRVAHELDHGVLHHREAAVVDRDDVVADRCGCCAGYVGFRLGDDVGIDGHVPTGTVKFFLCQPADVTAGGCEGKAGTQVGTAAGGETLAGGSVVVGFVREHDRDREVLLAGGVLG